jgi:hypothetical protein
MQHWLPLFKQETLVRLPLLPRLLLLLLPLLLRLQCLLCLHLQKFNLVKRR